MEANTCLICGVNGTTFLNLVDNRYKRLIKVCQSCGLGCTLTETSIEVSNVENYRFNNLGEWLFRLTGLTRVMYLRGLNIKNAQLIVDWGCGRGDFAALLKMWNPNIYGVEFNDETSLEARTSGLHVYSFTDEMNNLARDMKQSVGIIFAFHVLEHTNNPRLLVSLFDEILARDGKIIVEVPNLQSLQRKLSGQHWNGFDTRNHFYHFTPNSLCLLFAEQGFRVKKIETFSIEYGATMFFFSMIRKVTFGKLDLFDHFNLKSTKSNRLVSKIARMFFFLCLIPVAMLSITMEALFSLLGKGGVIRVTLVRTLE